jgi:hypothetical protein
MPVQYLSTEIGLPPGPPDGAVIREFLRLIFEKYRWFTPMRYSRFPSWDEKIDPAHIDYDALVSLYERHHSLCVAARTEKDFICIFPGRSESPPYSGTISWDTSVKSASKSSWRAAHAEQMPELMRLLCSPIATAGLAQDREGKIKRLVPHGIGLMETFTVKDYSEGLPGLFWRNFFGPPFVRLFGERLASLPEDCRKPLGDELVLVQPYELPTEAGTEYGNVRERTLIEHLGPECFYDHEHHTPPTRRPVLDHLSALLH